MHVLRDRWHDGVHLRHALPLAALVVELAGEDDVGRVLLGEVVMAAAGLVSRQFVAIATTMIAAAAAVAASSRW